jgi:hypothetical protein
MALAGLKDWLMHLDDRLGHDASDCFSLAWEFIVVFVDYLYNLKPYMKSM